MTGGSASGCRVSSGEIILLSDAVKTFLGNVAQARVSRVVSVRAYADDATPCVFVGCGSWPQPGEPVPPHRLPLNNKGTRARFARDFTSVARLIAEPPPGLLEDWPFFTAGPVPPAVALDGLTLVVEDASPDSVIAVLLLLGRLAGIDLNAEAAAWIDAVDDWEINGNADDPWTSWCVLASALAHSHFPIAAEARAEDFAAAWTDVLRFAVAALLKDLSPRAIPPLPDLPTWRRANAALRQEQSVYLDWLPHAAMVQLSLPLSGTDGRRVMVDGLLFVEDQATGGAKVFYRNDRERSPLGQGFAFAAHHRPASAGTGDAITISVDTRRGIDLRDLWAELEKRETAAWEAAGEKRPDGQPRPLQGIDNRYDQPWFITADGTLVGAPTTLRDGRPGSKLDWSDVREAIWKVYNPLNDVRVCATENGPPVPLLELSAATEAAHDKTLLVAHWPRVRGTGAGGELIGRALSAASIVSRVLAALIRSGRPAGPPSLDDLPIEGMWNRVELAGGFAIVGNDGLFILDDWRETKLPIVPIRKAFNEAADLDHQLRAFETDIVRPLVKGVGELLNRQKGWKNAEALVRKAVLAASRLTELRGRYALPPNDPNARLVWEALDRRWGFERRLGALEAEVKAIETSLRSLNDLRLARVGRTVALFAFPVAIANVFGQLSGKAAYPLFSSSSSLEDPPGWFILLAVCVTWALAMASLSLWLWNEGRIKSDK